MDSVVAKADSQIPGRYMALLAGEAEGLGGGVGIKRKEENSRPWELCGDAGEGGWRWRRAEGMNGDGKQMLSKRFLPTPRFLYYKSDFLCAGLT